MKYRFKVKNIGLSTGGIKVAVLSPEDAKEMDVWAKDRLLVHKDGRTLTTIVDIDVEGRFVKKGTIGFFYEVSRLLKTKDRDTVSVEPTGVPRSITYIRKKMDGGTLSEEEINEIIDDIIHDELSEGETSAFITSVYIRGLNTKETVALTNAIVHSGPTLKLEKEVILDKHCIGGVPGNRTTMLIVPMVVAAGGIMPKTSSRAITSPAGTADTMEVLAPVDLSVDEIKEVVNKVGGCIVWGGGSGMAAADDKLIQIRHPLRLDPEGVMIASILAKKKAVGATHVLIDIPIGKGAKILTRKEAQDLSRKLIHIGAELGMQVHCIITPGDHPIGNAIGPALEARQTLEILSGEKKVAELRKKAVIMAGLLLELGGLTEKGNGPKLAERTLSSGKALEKFREIIEAQGGNPKIKPEDIPLGDKRVTIKAEEGGRIFAINNKIIASIARVAGAPRDKGAGVFLYVEKGDKIKKGDKVMTIFAESERKLDAALEIYENNNPIELTEIVLEEYSPEITEVE